MIDIADNERRDRDRLMEEDDLPTPAPEVLSAMRSAGLFVQEPYEGYPLVRARLPAGWTKQADPISGRRFFLVDDKGERRFNVYWKAGHPFSGERAHGSISVIEPDAVQREWHGNHRMGERRFFLVRCSFCRLRSGQFVDDYASSLMLKIAERETERHFEIDHADTGCPKAKRPEGSVFYLTEDGELQPCDPGGPTIRVHDRRRASLLHDDSRPVTLSRRERRARARQGINYKTGKKIIGRRGARKIPKKLIVMPRWAGHRILTAKPVVSSRGRRALVYLPDPAGPAEVALAAAAMDREQEEAESKCRMAWWV